mmetsp:Transcript_42806/g.132212  ORF Transcript_42806/g.132212 Transcript_42806/m.132212 type:complete len:247 (-) Transcript_42806:267-1007(-)
MPIERAMASAVTGWSPVTMKTLMPARMQSATACGTPSRGGSMRATKPRNVRPDMGKFGISLSVSKGYSAVYVATSRSSDAKPSTRSPREPSCRLMSSNFWRTSSFMSTTLPSTRAVAHMSSTRSGAPLIMTCTGLPASSLALTESIHLLDELNGIAATRLFAARCSTMSRKGWMNLMRALSDASPLVGRLSTSGSTLPSSLARKTASVLSAMERRSIAKPSSSSLYIGKSSVVRSVVCGVVWITPS